MQLEWTGWARERLLPFPGEPWTPVVDLAASAARLAKVGVEIPAKLALAAEVKRGVALRLNQRYGADGNNPRDRNGRDAVDLWVAGAGVVVTTEILVETCKRDSVENPYNLRNDGLPWSRLREHLAAASPADRAAAKQLATAARAHDRAGSELRPALAYAFCDPAWVAEDLDAALEEGYGRLALLAALATPAQARHALEVLTGPDCTRYQIVENGFPHLPNLMTRLDEADADLVVTAAEMAWNKSTRKPWLEVVACLSTRRASAYLAKHGERAEKKHKPTPRKGPAKRRR